MKISSENFTAGQSISQGIFKAYDIRGIYPGELNERTTAAIARAYAVFLNRPRTLVVGRDVRESGPALMSVAIKALLESGVDVIDIGIVPVDVYYYAIVHFKADGGMYVSASHNSREWNGLNLARRGAEPISGSTGLKEIYELASRGERTSAETPGIVRKADCLGEYIDFVVKESGLATIRPMKVVLNGNFGVSARVFRLLVERAKLPLTLVGLNDEPDGTFPKGPPNPLLPENRGEMEALVRSEHADMGIAWDADGDRSFFVDEKGEFIEGYFITALLAQEVLKLHPGATILIDPRLVWATEEVGRTMDGKVIQTPAGMTLIAARAKEENAEFAGEMSGHYYFKSTWNRDNGFLPALLILKMLSGTGKMLSELADPFREKYHISGELNFEVASPDDLLSRAETIYRDGTIEHIDGLSVAYPTWRFNLRKSNTEPLVRLNVEALDQVTLKTEIVKLKELIASAQK